MKHLVKILCVMMALVCIGAALAGCAKTLSGTYKAEVMGSGAAALQKLVLSGVHQCQLVLRIVAGVAVEHLHTIQKAGHGTGQPRAVRVSLEDQNIILGGQAAKGKQILFINMRMGIEKFLREPVKKVFVIRSVRL